MKSQTRTKTTTMSTTTTTAYRMPPFVSTFVLSTLFICCALWPTTEAGNVRLGCHVRQYLQFTAVKHGCRPQNLVVDACFGRCDTYEIPELEFPFKSSHHDMCSYNDVEVATIELDDCDPGVNSTYVYANAKSCRCRNCSPHNTFCFGLSL